MKGRCPCGAVRYAVSSVRKGFSACHCTQCRKQSGRVWASAQVPDQALSIEGDYYDIADGLPQS